MKVLFVFGGLAHYLIPVLNRLNSVKGLEVLVVLPKEKSDAVGSGVFESHKGAGFKVFHLEERRSYYGKPMLKGLRQLVKEQKPSMMIMGWPYVLQWLFYPSLWWVCRKNKVKLVNRDIPFNVPRYEDAFEFYKYNHIELESDEDQNEVNSLMVQLKYAFVTVSRKLYFNMMDAHIFYSPIGIDIYESYGVKREKMFVSYNSIDTDVLLSVREKIIKEPSILPFNPYRIIHVGRLVKWKKVDLLIQVVSELISKYPQMELVIVGDGPELNALKQMTVDIGIDKHVRFTGAIYDAEQLGKYLLCSSIYVLAGMGGLSINEAMCFGKPIICSVADGTERELVREGQNGLYFKRGDVNDLKDKINDLLSDREKIESFGAESLAIIQHKINIHTVINGFLELFNSIGRPNVPLVYNVDKKH